MVQAGRAITWAINDSTVHHDCATTCHPPAPRSTAGPSDRSCCRVSADGLATAQRGARPRVAGAVSVWSTTSTVRYISTHNTHRTHAKRHAERPTERQRRTRTETLATPHTQATAAHERAETRDGRRARGREPTPAPIHSRGSRSSHPARSPLRRSAAAPTARRIPPFAAQVSIKLCGLSDLRDRAVRCTASEGG